jgi:hypothetical protein
MQSVHTRARLTWPSKLPLTRCKLGRHVRLVLLFAWLTLFPTERRLPQIEQILAI